MLSKSFYRTKLILLATFMGLFTISGCGSFSKNIIKNTTGPSSPSRYFLSIRADPPELPHPAGQTEISVKVWDDQGKPVSGVSVYLYPKLTYGGWLHDNIVVTSSDGTARTILKDTNLYGGTQYVEARLENLRSLAYILFIPDGGPGVINP